MGSFSGEGTFSVSKSVIGKVTLTPKSLLWG